MSEPAKVIVTTPDELEALVRRIVREEQQQRPSDGYMLLTEVADLVRVNERTIRNWVRLRGFPVHRVGTDMRFKRDEVAAWLEKRAEQPNVNVTHAVDALKRARG